MNVRGSVESERYRAATARESVTPRAVRRSTKAQHPQPSRVWAADVVNVYRQSQRYFVAPPSPPVRHDLQIPNPLPFA